MFLWELPPPSPGIWARWQGRQQGTQNAVSATTLKSGCVRGFDFRHKAFRAWYGALSPTLTCAMKCTRSTDQLRERWTTMWYARITLIARGRCKVSIVDRRHTKYVTRNNWFSWPLPSIVTLPSAAAQVVVQKAWPPPPPPPEYCYVLSWHLYFSTPIFSTTIFSTLSFFDTYIFDTYTIDTPIFSTPIFWAPIFLTSILSTPIFSITIFRHLYVFTPTYIFDTYIFDTYSFDTYILTPIFSTPIFDTFILKTYIFWHLQGAA